jgi:hypothetical protein
MKASMKKPVTAVIFGTVFDSYAKTVIMILFVNANMKLLMGTKIRLETAMGSVKMNNERPLDNSAGVSLKMDIDVKNMSNNREDSLLERLLIRKMTMLIITATAPVTTVRRLPGCVHFSGLMVRKMTIVSTASTDNPNIPRDKILMI